MQATNTLSIDTSMDCDQPQSTATPGEVCWTCLPWSALQLAAYHLDHLSEVQHGSLVCKSWHTALQARIKSLFMVVGTSCDESNLQQLRTRLNTFRNCNSITLYSTLALPANAANTAAMFAEVARHTAITQLTVSEVKGLAGAHYHAKAASAAFQAVLPHIPVMSHQLQHLKVKMMYCNNPDVVAASIAQLTNLRSLSLTTDMDGILAAHVPPLSTLQSLTSLKLDVAINDQEKDVQGLQQLSGITRLKILRLKAYFMPPHSRWEDVRCAPTQQNLQFVVNQLNSLW
eukprot:jgi/Chrzof1/14585/Cz09g08130.t1